MTLHPAWLASALLALSLAGAPALGGQSSPSSGDSRPADALAANLALPFASDLTGARQARVFAWIEDEAGSRNIWVAGPGVPAHARTAFTLSLIHI